MAFSSASQSHLRKHRSHRYDRHYLDLTYQDKQEKQGDGEHLWAGQDEYLRLLLIERNGQMVDRGVIKNRQRKKRDVGVHLHA